MRAYPTGRVATPKIASTRRPSASSAASSTDGSDLCNLKRAVVSGADRLSIVYSRSRKSLMHIDSLRSSHRNHQRPTRACSPSYRSRMVVVPRPVITVTVIHIIAIIDTSRLGKPQPEGLTSVGPAKFKVIPGACGHSISAASGLRGILALARIVKATGGCTRRGRHADRPGGQHHHSGNY